jgi:hypothetical protein
MTTALNRQVKTKGSTLWVSMGNKTIEDAAVAFAQMRNVEADKLFLVVRDEDNKEVEHELTVESFRGFRVSGLRGGE